VATWLKDKGGAIGAIAGTIAAFVAVLQLFVVTPMNQRFDTLERHVDQRFDALERHVDQRFEAVDQRFDAVDQRLDRLESEVSQLRQSTSGLRDRVSRSEGEINVLRDQLTNADAP